MIPFVHLIFGLAVGKTLDLRIGTVMIFAILPDIDQIFVFAYPIIRNGILHSLIAGSVLTFGAYLLSDRASTAKSCLTGHLSHLSLDLLCFNGITLLYPVKSFYSAGIFTETSILPNFAILSISLMALLSEDQIKEFKRPKIFS